MAQSDKGILAAGVVLMDRGMDSSIDPRLLPNNQAALLVNATVRGGYPHNRPGWNKITLNFATGTQSVIEDGKFQGAGVFTPRGGQPMLVAQIDGRQFRFDVFNGNTVQEITVANDRNSTNPFQTWFIQAEDWLLIQDGESRPLIFDGSSMRRAIAGEIPGGTMMEYGLGRIWVASPDGMQFVAGDLVGSSSGSPAYNYRDAVLKMTENDFLNEGGAFAVPYNSGGITAMKVITNLDSSLGQGPIEVFTTNGAFSVNAPFDRTTWKNLTYPIQSVSLLSPGAMGQNSTTPINGDLWYRSRDGIRSFVIARRDFTQWGNLPVSQEVRLFTDYDTSWLLRYGSSVNFDNRYLCTCAPVWDSTRGVYHSGVVVMDFDLISTIGARVGPEFQPAWDGMWTGLDIFQLLHVSYGGEDRCFAFILDEDEKIQLYELTYDQQYDFDGVTKKRIQWRVQTKLFDFGTPNSLKLIERADIAPTDIYGEVDFAFSYKSDENPCWNDWTNANFSLCSEQGDCAPTDCWTYQSFQKSFRSRVTLPSPPTTCAPNGSPSRQGTRQQVMLTITGACAIKQFVLYSRTLQEAPFNGCPASNPTCTEDICCPLDNNLQSV